MKWLDKLGSVVRILGGILLDARHPVSLEVGVEWGHNFRLILRALFWVGVLFPGLARAERPPIKVGVLFQLTGPAAELGRHGSQGVKMAEKEINERGGILGRKLEVLLTDEGDATTGVLEVRRYILQDRVDFLVGVNVSSVALAVSMEAKKHRKIILFTHAATGQLTGTWCHRYAFRLVANAVMDARAGASLMKDKLGKRWYGIGEDSEYGRDSWEAFQAAIRKVKPEVQFVGESWPKPFTTDYTPFIHEAMQAKPDAVWSTLWGGDLVAFIRMAKSLDFFEQVKFFVNPGGASLGVLGPLGDEMPGGLWVSTPYWFRYPASVNNRVFVKAYRTLYGEDPADVALSSYSTMYVLRQAIEEVGSLDTERIVATLEGITYHDPEGVKMIRREDHQVIEDVVWGRTTESDEYPFRVLDDLVIVPGKEIVRSVEETGCQMEGRGGSRPRVRRKRDD
ncbi:MAG: ABC transporter substrate-binding protein [Candidatus Methylomirabilales bacterium]